MNGPALSPRFRPPDTARGEDIRAQEGSKKKGPPAKRAAHMLEGLFIRQLFSVMRKTVPDSGLMGGALGKGIYTEMLDGAFSDELAKSGIGLADALERQLAGNAPSAAQPARALAVFAKSAQMMAMGTPDGTGFTYSAPDRPEGVSLSDNRSPLWPIAGQTAAQRDAQGWIESSPGEAVVAPRSGKVVHASPDMLVLEHENNLRTLYRGLKQPLARPGDLVLRGQTLGEVGQSGKIQFVEQ